jgi:hypothetical protein
MKGVGLITSPLFYLNHIQMKKMTELTDKVFKLKSSSTPLSYSIASKSTPKRPLLYFDGQTNRPLRYASNQKSPFEDEQDGNVILQPVVFEDGFLRVPRTNPVLQQFLFYHPDNGRIFVEVNSERDAEAELEQINLEADAILAAKSATIEDMERLARVMLGINPDKLSTSELKRDIMLLAKRYPEDFLDALDNGDLDGLSKVKMFLDKGLIGMRNNNRDVHYNLPKNKKRMLVVPFGEDHVSAIASFFITDEGIEVLKQLESQLD